MSDEKPADGLYWARFRLSEREEPWVIVRLVNGWHGGTVHWNCYEIGPPIPSVDECRAIAKANAGVDDPLYDGTPAAHPAWWRGLDRGAADVARMVGDWLDGKMLAGTYGEPFASLRDRIVALTRVEPAVEILRRFVTVSDRSSVPVAEPKRWRYYDSGYAQGVFCVGPRIVYISDLSFAEYTDSSGMTGMTDRPELSAQEAYQRLGNDAESDKAKATFCKLTGYVPTPNSREASLAKVAAAMGEKGGRPCTK